jgi:predicted RNA binding protein YcfA (HicA-like mRNA interferase family)
MSKLPVISGLECMKDFGKGWILLQAAGRKPYRNEAGQSLCSGGVPDHKEIDRGTLRAIIRQAGLSPNELLRLM